MIIYNLYCIQYELQSKGKAFKNFLYKLKQNLSVISLLKVVITVQDFLKIVFPVWVLALK